MKPTDRDAQRIAISTDERLFASSGNPLHAWDAYSRTRRIGDPIPGWVLDYFDAAVGGLGILLASAQRGEPIKAPAARVAEALGFKKGGRSGRGTIFSDYCTTMFDWGWARIGVQVADLVTSGEKREHALEVVADIEGISESTVDRAWKRFTAEFPDQVPAKFRKSPNS
jgi:hypothetical protein